MGALGRISDILGRLPAIRRLAVRGRRGALVGTFAVTVTAMLGMVGLGTEVGGWYIGKRHGQNVADGAALAGAMMLASSSSSSVAKTAATTEATNNGFTTGGNITVTANNPPASGPNSGSSSAVEVIVSQVQTPVFAGLFIPAMTINNRAVALVQSSGSACALALDGIAVKGLTEDLSSGGNATVNAPGCALASNATGPSSVTLFGSTSVTAGTMTAVGACSGCAAPRATLTTAATSFALPTTNPFTAIDALTMPTFSGATCASSPVPWETLVAGQHQAFCNGTLKLTNGNTLNLTPGTYFLYNTSISLQGGTLECSTSATSYVACTGGAGVTIILTGPSGGGITVNGGALVNLTAPTAAYALAHSFYACTGATPPSSNCPFAGVLFYQDPNVPASNTIKFNGNASATTVGAMYFPGQDVTYSGNGLDNSHCSELIADGIAFTGNTTSTFDVSGCATSGFVNIVPQVQRAVLVE